MILIHSLGHARNTLKNELNTLPLVSFRNKEFTFDKPNGEVENQNEYAH